MKFHHKNFNFIDFNPPNWNSEKKEVLAFD